MQSLRGWFSGSGGAPAGGATPGATPAPASRSGIDRPIGPHVGRQWKTGDPADRLLPHAPEAHAKLMRLRQGNEQAVVLARDAEERRMAAGHVKQDAEAYLDRVEKSRLHTSRPAPRNEYIFGPGETTPHIQPASDAQLREAAADFEAAKARFAAIGREADELAARRSRLPDDLLKYLEWLPAGIAIEAHRAKPAAPATLSEIEALRGQMAERRAEISRTKAAPPPSDDVKAVMRQQVARLAAAGRPNYLPAVEISGREIQFPQKQDNIQVATAAGTGVGFYPTTDTFAIFCWLHEEALVRKLESEIDELADDENALSVDEKAERIRALETEILDIERSEGALIEELERSGSTVMRRENCDPRAVLGLSSDLPVPAKWPSFI